MNGRVMMILGMHRSGTSMITHWLHRCGLDIGNKLVPGDVGNTDGHFEDEDFLMMHRKFMLKRSLPESGFIANAPASHDLFELQELKFLIDQKMRSKKQWGWKEPRTCLFLPMYRELLPEAHCLVIIRDFNDTVNSLVMRMYNVQEHKFQRKRGLSRLKWILFKRKSLEQLFALHAPAFLRTWVLYNEAILDHVAMVNRNSCLFVQYKTLLVDDRPAFQHMTDCWGFELNYIPFRDVFWESKLSDTRDIAPYIKDPLLLAQAENLMLRLAGCERTLAKQTVLT